mmetsp:Transcript_100322/g.299409  ORF Transcript_100322/g.299409 Transcript_100322/m.299409 type:complete len:231 (-) Transcript_100322:328-1020(-)
MSCRATNAVKRQRAGASKWTGCAAAPGSDTTAPSSQSSARRPPASAAKAAPRESSPPLSSSRNALPTTVLSGNLRSHRVTAASLPSPLGVCTLEKRSARMEGSRTASARLRSRSASTNSRSAAAVPGASAPPTLATPLWRTVAAALLSRLACSARSRLKRNVSGRRPMRSSTSASGRAAVMVSRPLIARIACPASTPASPAALPSKTLLTDGGVLHKISRPRGPSVKVTS